MNVTRPQFQSVPLTAGLKWPGGAGWRVEEKMDGVWAVREFGRSFVCGEAMKDGRFIAFDLPIFEGQDLRREPLRNRLALLADLERGELRGQFLRPATGTGGEFLEAVLARGGEGVVRKHLDGTWRDVWEKCKRVETFDLRVVDKDPFRGSLYLATIEGEPRGKVPCKAKFDSVLRRGRGGSGRVCANGQRETEGAAICQGATGQTGEHPAQGGTEMKPRQTLQRQIAAAPTHAQKWKIAVEAGNPLSEIERLTLDAAMLRRVSQHGKEWQDEALARLKESFATALFPALMQDKPEKFEDLIRAMADTRNQLEKGYRNKLSPKKRPV